MPGRPHGRRVMGLFRVSKGKYAEKPVTGSTVANFRATLFRKEFDRAFLESLKKSGFKGNTAELLFAARPRREKILRLLSGLERPTPREEYLRQSLALIPKDLEIDLKECNALAKEYYDKNPVKAVVGLVFSQFINEIRVEDMPDWRQASSFMEPLMELVEKTMGSRPIDN